MLYSTIIILTSPLVLFLSIIIFTIIAFAVSGSSVDHSPQKMAHIAASGMASVLLLIFCVSLFDIQTSCKLLIDNNLLQTEFIVITAYSMVHMLATFLLKAD